MSKTKLTTTFKLLRQNRACRSGYMKLAKHLGGITKYGRDTPINLLTILDSNGVEDTLWCLQVTEQNCGTLARLLACDFAESVSNAFEAFRPNDSRVHDLIEVTRRFAVGKATAVELDAAREAAWAAAWAARAARPAGAAACAAGAAACAAWAAARDAARDAAEAAARAARDAAWAAAASGAAAWASGAAGAAAWDAEVVKQAAIIRNYLEE